MTIDTKATYTLITTFELGFYMLKYLVYSEAMNIFMGKYKKGEAEIGIKGIGRMAELGNTWKWPTPIDLILSERLTRKLKQEATQKTREKDRNYRGRVVVYDLTQGSRKIIEEVIKEYDPFVDVELTTKGEELIQKIGKLPTSVVITEAMFPDYDITNVLSKIRSIDEKVPVIIISAYEEQATNALHMSTQSAPIVYINKDRTALEKLRKGLEDYLWLSK